MAVKLVCKHCKVPVVSKAKPLPVIGKEHKQSCPRKRMYG